MLATVLLHLGAAAATDVWTLAARPPIEASEPLLTAEDIPQLRRALATCPKGLSGRPPPGLDASNFTVNDAAATRGGPLAYVRRPQRCNRAKRLLVSMGVRDCEALSRGIGLYLTNPATLGDDAVIRVSAYSQCMSAQELAQGRNVLKMGITTDVHGTFRWLLKVNRRRGQYSCLTSGAEDPRLLDIAGRRYVTFMRNGNVAVREDGLHRLPMTSNPPRPFLAPLDEPDRAVVLKWPESSRQRPEKNWLLFTHGDELYALQWVCPQVTLQCDPASGSCRRLGAAPRLRKETHWCASEAARQIESPLKHLHGGAGPIYVREHDVLLALAHKYEHKRGVFPPRDYTHYFFTMRPRPPFEIVAFSRPFRFPAHYGDARDAIQFCASMELDGSDLVLAYGVADCVSMTTRVSVASLFAKSGALRI